jgi:hypothetical protein
MRINRDALGDRGEAIFRVLITELDSVTGPIFRPYFLGEKWPVVDFIVELLGVGNAVPYFFVQVKTTRTGYTRREKRLKISVAGDDIRRLASYPAPTYLVGIDKVSRSGFLVSANGENRESLSSLSTQFALDAANRRLLWEEVRDYWASHATFGLASRFTDLDWR